MIERPIFSNFLEINSNLEPKYVKDENNDGITDFVTFSDYFGSMSLMQGYSEGKYRLTNDLTYYLGLHGQYSSYNNAFSVEPRTSIK